MREFVELIIKDMKEKVFGPLMEGNGQRLHVPLRSVMLFGDLINSKKNYSISKTCRLSWAGTWINGCYILSERGKITLTKSESEIMYEAYKELLEITEQANINEMIEKLKGEE